MKNIKILMGLRNFLCWFSELYFVVCIRKALGTQFHLVFGFLRSIVWLFFVIIFCHLMWLHASLLPPLDLLLGEVHVAFLALKLAIHHHFVCFFFFFFWVIYFSSHWILWSYSLVVIEFYLVIIDICIFNLDDC